MTRSRATGPAPLLAAASKIVDAALSLDGAVVALVTMRAQDDSLLQHSVNTAVHSVIMGLGRRLRREALVTVCMGAMLHDLGKALVPPAVLAKPGRLTAEELSQVQAHPQFGRDLIRRDFAQFPESVGDIAHMHHERLDGTGYPHGLAADEIPLVARICTIADVFDALCAVRPYKPGWAPHRAAAYLRRHPEWFDAGLVELFLRQVAIYPSGSLVATRRQNIGIVIGQNEGNSAAPVVLVLADRHLRPVPAHVVDLARTPEEMPLSHGVRHLPRDMVGRIDRDAAQAVAEAYLAGRQRARGGLG
jgi:HD-GYP domain-containing protein (c-di-GMP phosphodiesterase class II)